MAILHVLPTGDPIEHEGRGLGCPYGPSVEHLIGPTGGAGTLVTHHSLDGRELRESGRGAPR
jgi:hypothetical protein